MLNVSPIWKVVALLLAISLAYGEHKSDASAILGVDLGFSYITSAYFTASGPVIASRFEAPEAYREMMLAVFNRTTDQICSNSSDQDPLLSDLNSILQRALTESRKQKGEAIRIGALFVADELVKSRGPCYEKIWTAFENISPYNVSVFNVRSARNRVFTFPPDDCFDENTFIKSNWWIDGVSVLVLEMTHSTFKVSLEEISVYGSAFGVLNTFTFPDIVWSTVNTDKLREGIISIFQDHQVEDLRSILFSAEHAATEADRVAIRNIIDTLDKAVPGLAAKVHDFGDGIEYRNAIGAACIAKQLVLHPYNLEHECTLHIPEDALHDEL